MIGKLKGLYRFAIRNRRTMDFNVNEFKKNRVNLEYYCCDLNLGDFLSPIICNYMLEKKKMSFDDKIKKAKHLLSVGSIIDFDYQDATVWGSGVLSEAAAFKIKKGYQRHRKLDIRAVRGPNTREILMNAGYECPEVYGDPGILMPLIYNPEIEKKYDVSYIAHMSDNVENDFWKDKHVIDMKTDDYKKVINEIKESKLIITSSLHGIILSESYGVPTIFVAKTVRNQMLKFYDWYESTGRKSFTIASNYECAEALEPSELPDLHEMQEKLMESFPYDMWK